MKLKDILQGVEVLEQNVSPETLEINDIQYDSRKVQQGALFVAIKGFQSDGHRYIPMAVEKGAAAVLCEDIPADRSVPYVRVRDSRLALAVCSGNFFGNPASQLKVVGVTGTNGKTTVTHLIRHILESVTGKKAGLVGTLGVSYGQDTVKTSHTTPESRELQEFFRKMLDEGCAYAVMEVSAHALSLHRTGGIPFAAVGYTNLSQDHLDFYGTMDAYAEAKAKLFSQCRCAVLNADDPWYAYMRERTPCPALTYSAKTASADLFAFDEKLYPDKVCFKLRYRCDEDLTGSSVKTQSGNPADSGNFSNKSGDDPDSENWFDSGNLPDKSSVGHDSGDTPESVNPADSGTLPDSVNCSDKSNVEPYSVNSPGKSDVETDGGNPADSGNLHDRSDSSDRCITDKTTKVYDVCLGMPGRYSVYNALTALGCCVSLGLPPDACVKALAGAKGVTGRMETVPTDGDFHILIDYAHTPDALEKLLTAVREGASGRVVTVFGCGGDRDRGKRAQMGAVGVKLSDYAILTSDNPRSEDPEAILSDMTKDLSPEQGRYRVIVSREEAIEWAIQHHEPGDVIILAGKGHETSQEIQGVRRPFDERIIVKRICEKL